MSATFGSVREALAYAYSCRRGPRAARPRWSRDPSDDTSVRRDPTDWVQIGAILHGPQPEGAGVAIGSDLDSELRDWALSDQPRSVLVRRVEERLRPLLRAAGLLRAAAGRNRVQRIDGEMAAPADRRGSPTTTLRETPRTSGSDE